MAEEPRPTTPLHPPTHPPMLAAELLAFCTDMEAAVIRTVEEGNMTKDLAICVHGTTKVGEGSECLWMVAWGRRQLPVWVHGTTKARDSTARRRGGQGGADSGFGAVWGAQADAHQPHLTHPPIHLSIGPLPQVTPDQYLNTEPWMDQLKVTFDRLRAEAK